MFSELFQYLIQYKELPVPGIGTFLLNREAASVDFPNKIINPPKYSFTMKHGSHLPSQFFFQWLAHKLSISDREAVFQFNNFAFEVRKKINDGGVLNWNNVGTLQRNAAGTIEFSPAPTVEIETPVTANKVIRPEATHSIRVGEEQRTSGEMTALLNQQDRPRSYWWLVAAIIGLLALLFIGWYLSEHRFDISSMASL